MAASSRPAVGGGRWPATPAWSCEVVLRRGAGVNTHPTLPVGYSHTEEAGGTRRRMAGLVLTILSRASLSSFDPAAGGGAGSSSRPSLSQREHPWFIDDLGSSVRIEPTAEVRSTTRHCAGLHLTSPAPRMLVIGELTRGVAVSLRVVEIEVALAR